MIVRLWFLGRFESTEPPILTWFYHKDYGYFLRDVLSALLAIASWWWIAFRICAINIVLRERGNRDLRYEVIALNTGLFVEACQLLMYFLIPHLCHADSNDPRIIIWKSHRIPLWFVFVLYVMTVLVGYFPRTFPNIFMPPILQS